MIFFETIWYHITNFFNFIGTGINNFLVNTINISRIYTSFYNNIVAPLPEVLKILILIILVATIIIGLIYLIRKFLKTMLVISILIVSILIIVR